MDNSSHFDNLLNSIKQIDSEILLNNRQKWEIWEGQKWKRGWGNEGWFWGKGWHKLRRAGNETDS